MIRKIFIETAISEAKLSTYKFKVGAVIFNKKEIISKGRNYKLRSIRSFSKKFIKYPYSIHAEVDAIIKAKKDLKGSSILVIRINKLGEFRISKPCIGCMNYIEYVGIKKLFYSINYYPFIEEIKLT